MPPAPACRLCCFGLLVAGLLVVLPARAGAPQRGSPATVAAAPGVLMAETKSGWRPVKAGEAPAAETKLVALFDATLRSANGAVSARLLADLGQRGPFPILDSAVMLHDDAKHDLALTPLRGLMVLTNTKEKGAATIRLAMRDETVFVTLHAPGAKLALEVYGRHAPGEPKLDDPKLDDPVFNLYFIVLQGDVLLRHGAKGIGLHAPPGPAILVWDSLLREPEVQRLEELPAGVAAMKEKDLKLMAEACAWAAKLASGSQAEVLKEGAASKNALERTAAVNAMGALDDVQGLFVTLASSPHADTRNQAVLALRNWLGRAPGQTIKLDAGLKKAGYTEVQARTLLRLLYGFTPAEKREPATYDVLLDSLKQSRPAIRQLAHWHLVRLVPDGKSITFNALAPEAELQRSYDQWRKLIPTGKLPNPSKTVPKVP
jgi:hypothetical protein